MPDTMRTKKLKTEVSNREFEDIGLELESVIVSTSKMMAEISSAYRSGRDRAFLPFAKAMGYAKTKEVLGILYEEIEDGPCAYSQSEWSTELHRLAQMEHLRWKMEELEGVKQELESTIARLAELKHRDA